MSGVLVFAEQRNGQIKQPVYELLGEGRRLASQLGEELVALLIGRHPEEQVTSLRGPDRIVLAGSDLFEKYSSEAYTRALTAAIEKVNPSVLLLGASAMGKDLAPRVAARTGSPFAGDCLAIQLDPENNIRARRPVFSGKLHAVLDLGTRRPRILTLRPNAFSPLKEAGQSAPVVERIDVPVDAADLKVRLKELVAAAGSRVELTEAQIIVSGGRGLKGPENFKMLEDLAEVLGAAVGASRAAVDAGWRPHACQVGLTGKTVSPALYIACGISGAIQHQAGMSSSKVIVAINKDPQAPIFKIADYGIVGDVFEIVPLMTQEFKKLKGE